MRFEDDPPVAYPRWVDGEPTNIAAAAADALEWLKLLKQVARLSGDSRLEEDGRQRLGACIASLESYLPASGEETK